MDEVEQRITSGTCAELLGAVTALGERPRKAAAAWALAQWKARGAPPTGDAHAAAAHYRRWIRWLIVLTATAADPKKALAIPVRHWSWSYDVGWKTEDPLTPTSADAMAALAEAAIGRGREWCAEYLALMLDAKKPRPMYIDVLLLIARAHDLRLPDTPIAAQLWATQFASRLPPEPRPDNPAYEREVPRFELAWRDGRCTVTGRDETVTRPADALRGDLDAEAMLLSLFDHRDAVGRLPGRYSSQYGMDATAAVVAELVADGTFRGGRLARQAIAALSRGDAVGTQRLQTRLLEAAAPGNDVVHEQARLLANLLATGNATPAAMAQALLRRADAETPLPDDLFIEACQIVFARKEKGLRADQLAWARARAGQPATVASAASGLVAALAAADHAVQRDAVAALENLWPALAGGQRVALLASIEASRGALDASLFARLWSTCAGGASTGSMVAAPPPAAAVPAPLRTGMTKEPFEAVADPAVLPADVQVMLQTYHGLRDPVAHERAVVAVMDALAAGQAALARRLAEKIGLQQPFAMVSRRPGCDMSYVAWARMDELLQAAQAGTPRAFVSRPSWAHGAIAPEHLIERLAKLAREGRAAPPRDLLVALLRTEACDADAIARLRAIGSGQAMAAADFLAAGGADQLKTRWLVVDGDAAVQPFHWRFETAWLRKGAREVCVALSPVAQRPAIDGAPMDWAAGFEPATAPFASEFDAAPAWIAPMLPNNAEALAALHLWGFRRAGLEHNTEGGKNVAIKLPEFLRAHGEAGPALHLAVLFAMSGNDAPVRVAGCDGLVTLLQQGRWRGALAAELVAECIRCGSVKPGRLAAALAQVHAAGETAAAWPVARAAAAAALALTPVPAATADLLAFGAEVAAALGIREPVAEVDAAVAAIKGKPNKLQAQAQRLQAVLAGRGT